MNEEAPEEPAAVSTIACEPCRQRKCKCNRALPICSSCSSDPSKCWYSQGSKRGIPAGYINSLETRLAETEAALYYALCELHSGYREQGSYGPLAEHLKQRYGHGKTDITKEWRESPMTSREQAQTWWIQRELDITSGRRPSGQRAPSRQSTSYGSGVGPASTMVPVVQMPQSSMAWQQFPASEVQFQNQLQMSPTPAAQFGQPGAMHSYHQQQSMASPTSLREVHSTHYDTDPRQPTGFQQVSGQSSSSASEQLSSKARALAEDQSNTYF